MMSAAAAAAASAAGATHAMAIAPVAGGAIFPIETRCHALEYDPPAVTGPVEDMDDPETRRMASARLTAAFSSQKRQRKVARVRAERAVDASTFASSSALQDALAARDRERDEREAALGARGRE